MTRFKKVIYNSFIYYLNSAKSLRSSLKYLLIFVLLSMNKAHGFSIVLASKHVDSVSQKQVKQSHLFKTKVINEDQDQDSSRKRKHRPKGTQVVAFFVPSLVFEQISVSENISLPKANHDLCISSRIYFSRRGPPIQ